MINPPFGSEVKVIFRNGSIVTGTIIQWSDNKSSIQGSDGIIIIQQTLQDVLFIKVIKIPQPAQIVQPNNELQPPNDNIPLENRSLSHRTQKLANLYLEKKKLEEEELRNKMRTFSGTGDIFKTNYGSQWSLFAKK